MKIQMIDYTSSSTEALAKEAVLLRDSYNDIREVNENITSKVDCLEHREMIGKLDSVYGFLIETHNSIIIELFDRFKIEFGFDEYYQANQCEDWLDEPRFIGWYEAVAADTTSSEQLYAKTQQVKHWAERLNKSDDE